jgi:hypothetical protein
VFTVSHLGDRFQLSLRFFVGGLIQEEADVTC